MLIVKNLYLKFFIVVTLLTFITTTAYAIQVILPSAVAPATLSESYSQARPLPPEALRLSIPIAVLTPKMQHKFIFLKRVVISGNTVIPTQTLQQFFTPYLNKKVNLDQLAIITGKITQLYRDNDYIISEALIPEQSAVKTGVLHIVIKERYLAYVKIEGNTTPILRKLLMLYGQQIINSRPLKYSVLMKYILLADSIPGIDVEGFVKPDTPDSDIGSITFKVQRKAIIGQAQFGKLGSSITGPYLINAAISANSIVGPGQFTNQFVGSIFNNSMEFYKGTLLEPFDKYGDQLIVIFSDLNNKPLGMFRPFDVVGISTTATVGIMHPILMKPAFRLYVNSDLNFKNSQQSVLGQLNTQDRQRTVDINIESDFWDKLEGVNIIQLGYVQGLGIFNGSHSGDPLLSSLAACPQCGFYQLSYFRTQSLTDNLTLGLGFDSQYSTHILLSGMRFDYGGLNYGPAYNQADFSGDKGILANAELDYDSNIGRKYLQHAMYFLYYDYGKLWKVNPLLEGGGTTDGATFGGGVRFDFSKHLSGVLESYKPLAISPTIPNENWRIFYTMIVRF